VKALVFAGVEKIFNRKGRKEQNKERQITGEFL
jgi:hypothetical protein